MALLSPLRNLAGVRYYSPDLKKFKDEAEDSEMETPAQLTGIMDYHKQREILVFFDNVYPRWLAKLRYSKFWGFLAHSIDFTQTDKEVQNFINGVVNSDKNPLPDQVKSQELVPLKRDGGVFVKFTVPPESSAQALLGVIESNIESNQSELSLRSFYRPKVTASLVKGTPWIEDLSRFPSRKLRVIFEGNPLTEEELYVLFRRYGTIIDIVPASLSIPTSTVIFRFTASCIRAKNCITGMVLDEGSTTLHLQYIPIERVNTVTSIIANHQRIAIPIILALLATIAVLIFEPIRRQFIEFQIKHYYSWDAHKDKWYIKAVTIPYKVIVSSLSDSKHFIGDSLENLTGGHKEEVDIEELDSDMYWSERSEKANQLRLWVCENANTFIVVKGPKGSGEKEFVTEHALNLDESFKKYLLEIDCNSLVKARSDNEFLKTGASQLGYFPLFTWTNTVSQFVDLGLQGLTGQKSGLSESKETQYKNMLLLALEAIRNVALHDFPAYKSEIDRQQKMKHADLTDNTDTKIIKEEDYLQLHPQVKPVIVINNFLRKSDSPHDFIYKVLADWAGQLIQNNLAHVIFITADSGSSLHLTAALPNQVFKTISLDDATPASAKHYVSKQLKDTSGHSRIDKCLEPLGGRMLDLQAFVRRVKLGERPEDALNEMIHQASEQITTFFLNVNTEQGSSDTPWNTAQLWALIRSLARDDHIDIDHLVLSPLFSLNYHTVQTLGVLEKNDLISLKRDKGIIKAVSTGRPLFKAAFKDLVDDQTVFKLYEANFYSELMALENNKIAKLEDQMCKLADSRDVRNMKERTEYLSSKILASTQKVQSYEAKLKEIAALGTVKKSWF